MPKQPAGWVVEYRCGKMRSWNLFHWGLFKSKRSASQERQRIMDGDELMCVFGWTYRVRPVFFGEGE